MYEASKLCSWIIDHQFHCSALFILHTTAIRRQLFIVITNEAMQGNRNRFVCSALCTLNWSSLYYSEALSIHTFIKYKWIVVRRWGWRVPETCATPCAVRIRGDLFGVLALDSPALGYCVCMISTIVYSNTVNNDGHQHPKENYNLLNIICARVSRTIGVRIFTA